MITAQISLLFIDPLNRLQNPEEKEVGARALLWAIEPSLCTNNSRLAMLDYNPVNGMPDGFMKSLAEQSESDGLPPILESICEPHMPHTPLHHQPSALFLLT